MSVLFEIAGNEESIAIHILISTISWWVSLVLMILTYKYRRIWDVGKMPWTFLILTFLLFGLRELAHFTSNPLFSSIRHIFGIWSAIFMTSAFLFLFVILCKQNIISPGMIYSPFILAFVFPAVLFYYYISGTGINEINFTMNTLENIMWIIGSSITIYTTYMLGSRASGGFIKVFMFFQFSAISAFVWKFLAIVELMGGVIPYSIREIVETIFSVFSIISVAILAKMLIKLHKEMYS